MACKRMRVNPETGKILRRGKRRMTVAFKGLSRDVEVKGWFPDDGSDGLMERGDGDAADAALRALKAEHAARACELAGRLAQRLSRLSPGRVTRKKPSLLLTGSQNSFSKYGRGDAAPSHPTLVLMTLLDRRPELLAEIKALAISPTA